MIVNQIYSNINAILKSLIPKNSSGDKVQKLEFRLIPWINFIHFQTVLIDERLSGFVIKPQ